MIKTINKLRIKFISILEYNITNNKIEKLAIAVPFFFVEKRICYLSKISSQFDSLAGNVEVYIFTNTEDEDQHRRIQDVLRNNEFKFKILAPKLIGHPYLLTWAHLDIFKKCFVDDKSITHFMYLEDDICVRRENIEYWLKGREDLRAFGLIPSFLRYEMKSNTGEPFSTDITKRLNPYKYSRAEISNHYVYLNLPNLYQGMYLLDRQLMDEHLLVITPDFGKWKIREKAAQGVTFVNVPKGCFSRNFVGYNLKTGQIDSDSLIHHTPNNYVDNPETKFAKILVRDVVYPKLRVGFERPRLKIVSKPMAKMYRYAPSPIHPALDRLFSLFS